MHRAFLKLASAPETDPERRRDGEKAVGEVGENGKGRPRSKSDTALPVSLDCLCVGLSARGHTSESALPAAKSSFSVEVVRQSSRPDHHHQHHRQ